MGETRIIYCFCLKKSLFLRHKSISARNCWHNTEACLPAFLCTPLQLTQMDTNSHSRILRHTNQLTRRWTLSLADCKPL